MTPNEKINRASFNLMQSVKDTLRKNVAAVGAQFGVQGESLNRFIGLIEASTDEGYNNGIRVFNRVVDEALKDKKTKFAAPKRD